MVPRAALPVLVLVVASACSASSSPGDPGGCPSLSTVCPATVPSWNGQVDAIVDASCATSSCHGKGGVEAEKIDLSTYEGVKANAASAITQVNACLMPDRSAGLPVPALSDANRQVLLSWLVCGAPDN